MLICHCFIILSWLTIFSMKRILNLFHYSRFLFCRYAGINFFLLFRYRFTLYCYCFIHEYSEVIFFLYSKRLLRRNRELHLYHDIKPQLFSKPDRRFLILSLLLVNIAHVAFISYAYIVLKQ